MVDLRVWSTVSLGVVAIALASAAFYYQGKKRMDKYSGHKNVLAALASAFGSDKDYPV